MCDGSTAASSACLTTAQPSVAELGFGLGQPAQLAVEHGGGHRPGAAAIAPAALRRIGAEHNGDGRQAGLARELGVDPPPLRVEAERVDDRIQAAP